MTELFNKRGRIVIAKPITSLPDGYFTPELNGISVEDFRFAFEVESHLGSEPNTCKITIANLAEDLRDAITRLPAQVQLYAGYADADTVGLIASGDLRYGVSYPDGANVFTELEIADGARARGLARMSKAYGRGATPRDALKDTAASMGLKLPQNLNDAKELLTQFGSGLSLQGYSRDHLDTILKPRGYGWSIQKGSLVVQRRNETSSEELIISPASRLIDTPRFGTPKKPGQAPPILVKAQLWPDMAPGKRLRVDNTEGAGSYKVVRVKHVGDTHGPAWQTEIEGKAL